MRHGDGRIIRVNEIEADSDTETIRIVTGIDADLWNGSGLVGHMTGWPETPPGPPGRWAYPMRVATGAYAIKGNIPAKGENIYRTPDTRDDDRTRISVASPRLGGRPAASGAGPT